MGPEVETGGPKGEKLPVFHYNYMPKKAVLQISSMNFRLGHLLERQCMELIYHNGSGCRDTSTTGDELLNTLKLALHHGDPSPAARPEVQQLEEMKPDYFHGSGYGAAIVPPTNGGVKGFLILLSVRVEVNHGMLYETVLQECKANTKTDVYRLQFSSNRIRISDWEFSWRGNAWCWFTTMVNFNCEGRMDN
ncbi:hypothetical protein C5167_045256 [Papaver somniferum]|uniref:Uncharacterized protein n=1 Tax=Papaver somniferum TaxID=3469 RepID=A0A4Y7LB41_PAPSO|nr:hypothetical protein C5167_045256 [Papaver somniferum]